MYFHPLPQEYVAKYPLPESFTNPFDYTAHPLVRIASEMVAEWVEPLDEGKMFGVLIVEREGEVGFIAAFSGMLNGSYSHPKFVPTIFDIESSESYIMGQERLREITQSIESLKNSLDYRSLKELLIVERERVENELAALRTEYAQSKLNRKQLREGADEQTLKRLNGESVAQKRAIKEQRAQLIASLDSIKGAIAKYDDRIKELRAVRSALSLSSQESIFKEFRLHNAKGECDSLYAIFDRATSQLPPSGAGECAAPKMVEYALCRGFKLLAMGEFWLGASPKAEPRYSGEFYTSCHGKCNPILNYMLSGLSIAKSVEKELPEPAILFEDEHIILFDKPSGMLSVSGKVSQNSLDKYLPNLHTVHRLDMDTSGVIIFAKSREVKVALQRLFEERSLKKSYVALCRGEITPRIGSVTLPLRGDFDDRPRQIVDYEQGKRAVTEYEVVGYLDGVSRVIFHPITGRTHQLRLHAAHPDGLAAPIVGDRLYGRADSRLHLHAFSLTFRHPITSVEMTITSEAPF